MSKEPRHPSVIVGAMQVEVDILRQKHPESFAAERLEKLVEELDEVLLLNQLERSFELVTKNDHLGAREKA
jgi:hypothetical protein